MVRNFLLIAAVFIASAAPLQAAQKPNAVARYWRDFKAFWANAFGSQSGVVLTTLAVGALAMFIITRGKWKK
jgi:uncharacterized membrane protein